MSDLDQEKGCVILLAILLIPAIIGFNIGNPYGFYNGTNAVRQEAVKKGYAEWVPNEKGWSEFKWRQSNVQTNN